jgi:hypothetical protein
MRAFITSLVATSILAGVVAPVSAANRHKHKKKHVRYQAYVAKNAANDYGFIPNGQIEYDLRKIPFGSQLWWQQSERERGGGDGGGGGGGGGR